MGEPFSQKEASFLQINKWKLLNPQLIVGLTTRLTGFSGEPYESLNMGLHVFDDYETVIANRKSLATTISMPTENWVAGEQTHETNIIEVRPEDKGKGAFSSQTSIRKTDGLITKEVNILNTAFFADCVPLYFFDPQSGYIGIAHAGWKGTINNMASKMVDRLQSKGVKLENLLVAIGPCISQKHYEVDAFIVNQLDEEIRKTSVIKKGNNRYLLDLKQVNVEMFLRAGVLHSNIETTNYCTYTNDELFYSYRRDGGKTGRMLGFIGYNKQ